MYDLLIRLKHSKRLAVKGWLWYDLLIRKIGCSKQHFERFWYFFVFVVMKECSADDRNQNGCWLRESVCTIVSWKEVTVKTPQGTTLEPRTAPVHMEFMSCLMSLSLTIWLGFIINNASNSDKCFRVVLGTWTDFSEITVLTLNVIVLLPRDHSYLR